MTPVTRIKIVATALCAIALWQPVHHFLVRRYDLNPWKLFGLSMYCLPHASHIRILDMSEPGGRLLRTAELSAETVAMIEKFDGDRNDLGQLASPDRIAGRILEELPHVRGLAIEVVVVRLDSNPRTVSERWRWYKFER